VLVWPQPTYGTDFKGGTEVEVAFTKPIEAGQVRSAVHAIGFAAPDIVSVSDPANPNRFLIRVQEVSSLDESMRAAIDKVLCYSPDGNLPSDECPPDARANEVKFSPGGDKIFARYDKDPNLAEVGERLKSVPGVELRPGAKNPQVVSERDHRV